MFRTCCVLLAILGGQAQAESPIFMMPCFDALIMYENHIDEDVNTELDSFYSLWLASIGSEDTLAQAHQVFSEVCVDAPKRTISDVASKAASTFSDSTIKLIIE